MKRKSILQFVNTVLGETLPQGAKMAGSRVIVTSLGSQNAYPLAREGHAFVGEL